MAAALSVQQQIWSVDAQQPISEIRSLDSIARQSVAMDRFITWLLGIFGTLVVVLAAVGIYGVISYSVTQRSNEIGIRMALGASRLRVLRMIVEDGLRLTTGGIIAGLLLRSLADADLTVDAVQRASVGTGDLWCDRGSAVIDCVGGITSTSTPSDGRRSYRGVTV